MVYENVCLSLQNRILVAIDSVISQSGCHILKVYFAFFVKPSLNSLAKDGTKALNLNLFNKFVPAAHLQLSCICDIV